MTEINKDIVLYIVDNCKEEININTPGVGKPLLFLCKNEEELDFLLSLGADINIKEYNYEKTFLFDSDIEMSKLLLKKGIDINIASRTFGNALYFAQDLDKIKLLIESGIDKDLKLYQFGEEKVLFDMLLSRYEKEEPLIYEYLWSIKTNEEKQKITQNIENILSENKKNNRKRI